MPSSRRNEGFRSYEQFQNEVLSYRAGPLVSTAEDLADEMYQGHLSEEFDSMWDSQDD